MQQSISGKGPAVDSSMLLASKRKALLKSAEVSYATNPKKMLIKSSEQLQDRKQCAQACADIAVYTGPEITFPPSPYRSWTFEMYDAKLDHGSVPIITNPATWGTRNDTLLTPLLLTGDNPTADGAVVPFKEDQPEYNYVSLHITGSYIAPANGSYVFTVVSDDGVTIKLGGVTIMSHPTYTAAGTYTSTPITLTKGTKYPIEILWSNGTGGLELTFTDTLVNGTTHYPFNPQCDSA